MQEQINQIQKYLNQVKEMLVGLDFAIKNHRHLESDLSAKLDDRYRTYSGYVKADGTFAASPYFLPSKWSATKNSAGNYTISHNIGHANYVVTANKIAGEYATYKGNAGVNSGYTGTSFTLETHIDTAGASAVADSDFTFIVVEKLR